MFIPQKQYFSFPPDVIKHLWQNPFSASGLLKLYQTCKYFYYKRQILIFNDEVWNNWKYKELLLSRITNSNVSVWLDGRIFLPMPSIFDFTKLYRCTAETLRIMNEDLSFNEFEMLVAENTIKGFQFCYGTIKNSDNSLVPVNVILSMLPYAYNFEYKVSHEKYSVETLTKMNEIKLFHKFKNLIILLYAVSNTFDPLLLCKFFEQNISDNSVISISVGGYNLRNTKKILEKCIQKLLQKWIGKKPVITVRS